MRRIKTIIFDIGNVLMHFDYMPYVRNLLKDEHLVDIVNGAIWRTGYWNDLDRGEPVEKIFPLMLAAAPGYEEEVRLTFENIGQCFHPADYAIPWIKELKNRGYQLLYLSNYSEYGMKANPSALDFMPLMDGGVFSCYVHLLKPDPKIYKKICDKYHLKPEECVFIDDNEDNICAANEFGLNAVRFTDYSETRIRVEQLLDQEILLGL